MNSDGAPGDTSTRLRQAAASRPADTASIVETAERVLGNVSFTVSDLTQVGQPIVYASPAFEALTGYRPDEAAGRNLGFLQLDDSDQPGSEQVRAAVGEGKPCTCTVRNYRRDGTLFFNEQRHVPLGPPSGRPTHLLVQQRDVTALAHAAGAEVARAALAEQTDGVGASFAYAVLLGMDGAVRLTWASPSCRGLTGFGPEELAGRGLDDLVLDEDRAAFLEAFASLGSEQQRRHAYRLRSRGGRVLWVEDLATVQWVAAETGVRAVYGVIRDVSQVRHISPELWRGAHHDALTGLPNRYLLDDRIQHALQHSRREGGVTALAVVDLDDFAFLNETLGPEQGDRVLQEVASRLQRQLRRSDTLARLEGDSFAVLLTRLSDARSTLAVLDKIRSVVADPYHVGGATLRLSATIGAELYPDGAGNAGDLLAHALTALEQGKEHQRGDYRFYAPGFDAAMRERAGLEKELRRAVLEDQLVLHYQPRVELQSGAITSVEALVRWAHPERGLLKPAAFVPLAEDVHLGGELFGWVLERACAQAKRWQQQRTSRRVAVNVSPQALEDDDFTQRIQAALTRYDLHPGLLEIEINERTGADTLEAAERHLQQLRGMGVHVALDDFGVAHASVSLLRAMPLDGLKIDRSFVGRLSGSDAGEDVELIRAIIALGKSLRLKVTAEGIETREQNSLLRSLACDEGQGFLYSQAVPAEYVPAFA